MPTRTTDMVPVGTATIEGTDMNMPTMDINITIDAITDGTHPHRDSSTGGGSTTAIDMPFVDTVTSMTTALIDAAIMDATTGTTMTGNVMIGLVITRDATMVAAETMDPVATNETATIAAIRNIDDG